VRAQSEKSLSARRLSYVDLTQGLAARSRYEATFAARTEEHEKATEAYETALEQWEQQKAQPAT
jgi:hypothetical protein